MQKYIQKFSNMLQPKGEKKKKRKEPKYLYIWMTRKMVVSVTNWEIQMEMSSQ